MKNVNFLKENLSGVYMINCRYNGKVYIGSSNVVYGRISGHLNQLRNGTHYCGGCSKEKSEIQLDFDLYGESNFDFFIIESFKKIDDKDLKELEFKYMVKYNSLNSPFGYNKSIPNGTAALVFKSAVNCITINKTQKNKINNFSLSNLTKKEIKEISKISKNIKFR